MNNQIYSVFDIAEWFLSKLPKISNKKLQKLVYYAYCWYLTFFNEDDEHIENRFFENKFEAWIHGAVYPELYQKYKGYGSSPIPQYTGSLKEFSSDDEDLLNQVMEVYGAYTGNALESICRQESPRQKARGNVSSNIASDNLINDVEIFKCFSERL